ncbi:MAG: amidohydrolase [Bacteroidetes bacterium]|nr:amidohydrolase [Bacteroidota bacterium]
MTDLTITIIQSELFWEDTDANLEIFSKKLASVAEGTDLVILPEMFSTGFTMNAKGCAEMMNGKTVEWLRKKAIEKKCVLTGSVIISEDGRFFNRLIWMKPDGTFDCYDKRHLFRLADEQETYSPGNKKMIAEINGWKICPLICYDLRFPVWSRRTKQEDYDLLIYVANWPDRRVHAWKQLLVARAIENQSYVAGVNRIGNDGNNIYHSGYSSVIDFKGERLSQTKPGEESMETIVLNKQALIDFRKTFAFADDADEFRLV